MIIGRLPSAVGRGRRRSAVRSGPTASAAVTRVRRSRWAAAVVVPVALAASLEAAAAAAAAAAAEAAAEAEAEAVAEAVAEAEAEAALPSTAGRRRWRSGKGGRSGGLVRGECGE